MSVEEIRICRDHQEYETPLLWTFAFNGAEYWCPYCGANLGMMGAGIRVKATPELLDRHEKYKQASDKYLEAKSISVCVRLEWEGKQISPDDLPQEEKDRVESILKAGWNYETEVENIILN